MTTYYFSVLLICTLVFGSIIGAYFTTAEYRIRFDKPADHKRLLLSGVRSCLKRSAPDSCDQLDRSRWKVSLLWNKNPAPLPAYRVRLHMFLRDYISVIFHASALSLRSVDRCRDRSPVLPLQFPSSRNAKRNHDLHRLSSHLFSRFSHHLCCSWAALTVFKTCFRQPYPIYKAYLEL